MKKYLYIVKTQIIKSMTYEFNVYGNIIMQVIIMLIGVTLIRGGIYIFLGSTSFHTRSAVDFGQYTQEIMDKTTGHRIIYLEDK